jgi:hypothetical protein
VRPSRTWGAYWRSVRPKNKESGMIRDRDTRLALFSPQVLDGLCLRSRTGRVLAGTVADRARD